MSFYWNSQRPPKQYLKSLVTRQQRKCNCFGRGLNVTPSPLTKKNTCKWAKDFYLYYCRRKRCEKPLRIQLLDSRVLPNIQTLWNLKGFVSLLIVNFLAHPSSQTNFRIGEISGCDDHQPFRYSASVQTLKPFCITLWDERYIRIIVASLDVTSSFMLGSPRHKITINVLSRPICVL